MTILNFGSCCIDNVYLVPHFAQPGETLPCSEFNIYPGGKGLNQSLAIARAGVPVRHAGKVGADGVWLKQLLDKAGVDTTFLTVGDGPSGHANIQVSATGENSIVLFGGSNQTITHGDVDAILSHAQNGDFLLLQNEISALDYIIARAAALGLRIVFNAAPMTQAVLDFPLAAMELLFINEVEGAALTNQSEPEAILDTLLADYPSLGVVLTLGAQGAVFADKDRRISQSSEAVTAVDTTGAGDTFTGYFLARYSQGKSIQDCLLVASRAAALCVTRPGAASSIPDMSELTIENHQA